PQRSRWIAGARSGDGGYRRPCGSGSCDAAAHAPPALHGGWLAAGLALSDLTARVRDWLDMTGELRYEQLSLSIAPTPSLVPRIHGVEVKSLEQLYPLLIAPVFAHGPVPHDVVEAHVLNAWVMASACIPAYLLAHDVTRRRLWAYVVAALSVCMPW